MKDFTIFNSIDRLKEIGDLFKGALGKGIDLEKQLQKRKAPLANKTASCSAIQIK